MCLALAERRLRARYKQTALGVAWVLVQPLITTVVFSFIFGRLAGLPSDGLPYPVFVFSGLVVWNFFSATISAASQCLVEDRDLITKIWFPRILAPIAAALPPAIDMTISLAVLAVVAAAYGVVPGLALLTLPLWLALLFVLAVGVGTFLAALNVKYRDVGQAIAFLVQLWLFVSPVVYASASVTGVERTLLALNPMTGILDAWRWAAVGAAAPSAIDLVSVASGVLLVASALVYFQRVERRFADVI